jgi:hypothetical protein
VKILEEDELKMEIERDADRSSRKELDEEERRLKCVFDGEDGSSDNDIKGSELMKEEDQMKGNFTFLNINFESVKLIFGDDVF